MNQPAPDKEFWSLADTFITLANEKCDQVRHTKVSAALLYATARFNSFVAASHAKSKEEFVAQREAQIAYFREEYEKMLRENLTDYGTHFDKYTADKKL